MGYSLFETAIPALFAFVGFTLQRKVSKESGEELRDWAPPPSPPPTPPLLHEKSPSGYRKKEKKKKKTYRSRYEINLDELEDEDEEGGDLGGRNDSNKLQTGALVFCFFCCSSAASTGAIEPSSSKGEKTEVVPFEDEPRRPVSKYELMRQELKLADHESESSSLVDRLYGEEDGTVATNQDEGDGETVESGEKKKKKQLTDEERAEIERRKAKQQKRMRKHVEKQEKEEFVEKTVKEYDPLARYNIRYAPYGKLKGVPMSLDFMNSSHAKRAYDIVVNRKMKRLAAMKTAVMNGAIDTIALNSGPEERYVPDGFYISSHIPALDMSFNGEIAMILWEQEMNVDQFKVGDPALGWYMAKVHSHCNRDPYNFIMKYSKEITGIRKLDGFVNTILDPAGYHGYGRRWVWLRPTSTRDIAVGGVGEEYTPSGDQNNVILQIVTDGNGGDGSEEEEEDEDENEEEDLKPTQFEVSASLIKDSNAITANTTGAILG